MSRFSTAIAGASLAFLAAGALNAQTVTQSNGTVYTTNGPIEDNVRINEMGNVTVKAYWGAFSKSYTLGALTGGNFGFSDNDLTFSASGAGDSFFTWWTLNNDRRANLTRLEIDAASTSILFDRTLQNNGVGTPGSNIGNDVQACNFLCLGGDVWNSQVLYTNVVGLSPNAPVGDLYHRLEINFNNGGVQSGFFAESFLKFDTDKSLSAVVTPEPSTYALMAAGLLGIFGAARRRRRQA